jgi:hypothetical protein
VSEIFLGLSVDNDLKVAALVQIDRGNPDVLGAADRGHTDCQGCDTKDGFAMAQETLGL